MMIKNSKRRGYAALVFLFSAMLFIIPTLAFTFRQLVKFSDLTDILLQQKQEKISILTSEKKSIEHLHHEVSLIILMDESVNPISSSELLFHENLETIGNHTLSSEIYYMNYVVSDDSVISDALKYPPSQKIIADERHFLIVTTLIKTDMPSFRKETAVIVSPSGDISELWQREFVIY